jgi:acetylornithine deacetylase
VGPAAGRERPPALGRGSVHASLVSGGRDLATYPERCTTGIERRTLPGEGQREVEAELDALLDECRRVDPELVATARTLLVRDPLETPQDASVVAAVHRAATGVLGSPPQTVGASFWADSAFIAAAGIPTVLFGPGGEGAHADVEWVSIRDTIACAEVLVSAAAEICG